MNKQRVTQKFIKGRYNNIIVVPYCGLQHLLTFTPCPYYTTRTEGWGSDISGLDYNTVIVTGYAPFGNIRVDSETCKRYEQKAREALYKGSDREELDNLINEFIKEVVK